MSTIVMIPPMLKPILTIKTRAFVPNGNRRAGLNALEFRGLLLHSASRTSKSLEMLALSTDFPKSDISSWASGSS